MKFLLSFILVLGSLAGIAICFFGDVTVDSTVALFDGADVSMWMGIFFVAVFIGGISLLFSRDTL